MDMFLLKNHSLKWIKEVKTANKILKCPDLGGVDFPKIWVDLGVGSLYASLECRVLICVLNESTGKIYKNFAEISSRAEILQKMKIFKIYMKTAFNGLGAMYRILAKIYSKIMKIRKERLSRKKNPCIKILAWVFEFYPFPLIFPIFSIPYKLFRFLL